VPGVETSIFSALGDRLQQLVLSPAVPISWPNLSFTPRGAYLRPYPLPARTESMGVSYQSPNDYRGIYQVDVFWPVNQNPISAYECASAIIAHFKKGTKMVRDGISVWVEGPPWQSPPLEEPSWFHVPVNVPYRAFVPAT